MNIGPHTFEEFKEMARRFHGYPAPGLLLGGYMVEMAKAKLPEGTLFEALVETGKCLPDAVQLLTLCSTGNNWMKVVNLGRYALTLYDKHTGEGWRVSVDAARLDAWPAIRDWLLKRTPKRDQDTEALFAAIKEAGDTICKAEPVFARADYLNKHGMRDIGVCPACGEPYPVRDGSVCRGCQGEAPYTHARRPEVIDECPPLTAVPVQDAVGRTALHDMTQVEPGTSKEAVFRAGEVITAGDLCRLQQMGRNEVYVREYTGEAVDGDWVHEDEAVRAFAARIAGPGITPEAEPHEGKLDFVPEHDGLLCIDRARLSAFNMSPGVMCATRQGDIFVEQGKKVAGCRAIPLFLARDAFQQALAALGEGPVLSVLPMKKARVGILVTGSEVAGGLIEDRFIPIISGKVERFGCTVACTDIVHDDRAAIADTARRMLDQGIDLLVTTAGLSVDPGDVTRQGLVDAGLANTLYGAPVLPGTMILLGNMGDTTVCGVPACALFFKTTSFDLLLPRLLAGQRIERADLARMAEGGYCLNCRACTFPKCPFGK